MRWCAYWVHRRTMDNGMRITVFSAVCEALLTQGKVRLHRFAWIFTGWGNCTPDSVPATLSGVSCFDGVIGMKTPDFSPFSLSLKISLHFCHSPRMPFLPLPFQRRIPALARSPTFSNKQGHGAASLAGVSHSGGHAVFKVLSSPDKYSLTKNRACSRISKRLENGCEKRKFPRL